jgi:hypothetical protein
MAAFSISTPPRPAGTPLSASRELLGASLRAWKTDVVLDVVDHSLEEARKAREASELKRREREEQEAREAARIQELRAAREEQEAEDAKRLAEEHAARAREEARLALLLGN